MIIKKIKQNSTYIIMLLVFIGMTIWNYTTPFLNDDEQMSHMSFHQIINQGVSDYFYWNGRFIGQLIFHSLDNIPLSIESVLNAAVFISLSILILFISDSSKNKIKITNYIFVLFIIFGLTSDFAQIYIWRAGAGNYLWTTTLDLLFIFLIKLDLDFNSRLKNIIYLIFISLLGLIVGETNENTVAGVILLIIFYMFFKKLSIKKYIYPLISTIIGYVILILSPGDWNRAKLQNPDFLKLNIFEKIHVNLYGYMRFIFHNEMFLIILFLILFILNIIFKTNKDNKALLESAFWFIVGNLTWVILLVSPGGNEEQQTHFGGFIFITISIVILFNISKLNNYKLNILNGIIVLVLGIYTVYNLSYGILDSYKTNVSIDERNSYILSEKQKGNYNVKVNLLKYMGQSRYAITFAQFDLTNDPNSWINQATAHYLGVNKIIVKNK